MTTTTDSFPPLVLLHGFLSDCRLWDGVMAGLDKRIPVIAPDFPGFGKQPPLMTEPSIEMLAEFVAHELCERGIERAFVAGMSMGGYVALALAERHPQLLAGLGLISTQAVADTPAKARLRRITAAAIHRQGLDAILPAFLPLLFPQHQPVSPELIRIGREAAHRADPNGACWALEAMARRPDRTELLKCVRVPALVIHGLEDQIMSPHHAREMATLLPTARLVELPEIGHATPWEAPNRLAEALSKWIIG